MAIYIPSQQFDIPEDRVFTGHPIQLPMFEGPLDLLVWLIRREQIDVYDIPVSKITEQYLGYLALLESMNIELAGDFLVMAATLMEIKSRMLLPKPPAAEEIEDEIDPRAELVAKLLEYRRYKEAACNLDEIAKEKRFMLPRPTNEEPSEGVGFVLSGNVTAFHLWSAFQEVLARAKDSVLGEIIRPRFTVAQKIAEIAAILRRAKEGVSFFSLFAEDVTKLEVIVTFLAVLELIRQTHLQISQPKPFGDIYLSLRVEAVN